MFPNPDYHKKVDEGKKWLLENLPCYSRWYRFLLFWPGSDQLLNSLIVDPKWPTENCSINEENELMRQVFVDAMLNQPVRPQSVCLLIVEAVTGGCPDEPLYVDD